MYVYKHPLISAVVYVNTDIYTEKVLSDNALVKRG